jgi:hypothetical protein
MSHADWPKDYYWLPFPSLPQPQRWEGVVKDRARINDPDFHGGKTEAIRMIVEWREEPVHIPAYGPYPPRMGTRRIPVVGPWIEFRNFKEANAYVQLWKRT